MLNFISNTLLGKMAPITGVILVLVQTRAEPGINVNQAASNNNNCLSTGESGRGGGGLDQWR